MTKKSTKYAWWIFIVCTLINFIGFGLIINTVGLFYNPIGSAFHIGRAQVALMTTFQNIAQAITLVFAGKLMSKLNLRWLLTSCFIIMGLGLILLNQASSITMFYVAWSVIGVAQPFALGLATPVLLGNWFKKKYGTVLGIALGVSAFGGTVFNPIIGSAITSFGWRNGLLIEGTLVLIILVPLCLTIKGEPDSKHPAYGYDDPELNKKDQSKNKGLTFMQALKTPMFYCLAFAMISLQFIAGFVQHISAHIVNIGLPLTVGATVVSGVMLGAAVGKISIGYFLDKLNNSLVVTVYTMFGVIGWSGLLLLRNDVGLVITGFILGLGQGIMLVSLPYFIRKQFGSKDYSTILSIISMLGAVSSAAAVTIDGLFFDLAHSYITPLTLNVILYVLAGLAIIVSINVTKKVSKDSRVIKNDN